MGPWRKRILILGATHTAELAMRGLAGDPFLGYEVAGLLMKTQSARQMFRNL